MNDEYKLKIGDKRPGQCKTYGFPAWVMAGGLVEHQIDWRPRKIARRRKREVDLAGLSEAQCYVLLCLQRVTVVPGWDMADLDNDARRCLQRMDRKQWFGKADKAGRLHHNLANCPSEARRMLRLDGEPLVGVDFSALHPHLLLSLYPLDHPERAKLAEWLAGDFYTRLDPACATNPKHRKRVKREFNAALNDELTNEWRYRVFRDRFAAEFPHGAEIVRALKRRDHRDAAAKFQRLESDLIFKEVMAVCMAEQIPAISLHDALYVRPCDAERVRDIMVAAARRSLGIDINAKIAA